MVTSDTHIFKRILKDTLLAKSNEVENFLNEIETYYNFISLNYQDFFSFVQAKIISYSTYIKLRLFYRYVWGEGHEKTMAQLETMTRTDWLNIAPTDIPGKTTNHAVTSPSIKDIVQRRSVVKIQSLFRRHQARKFYQQTFQSIHVLQSFVRNISCKSKLRLHQAYTTPSDFTAITPTSTNITTHSHSTRTPKQTFIHRRHNIIPIPTTITFKPPYLAIPLNTILAIFMINSLMNMHLPPTTKASYTLPPIEVPPEPPPF